MAIWAILVVAALNALERPDKTAGAAQLGLVLALAVCWLMIGRHLRRAAERDAGVTQPTPDERAA